MLGCPLWLTRLWRCVLLLRKSLLMEMADDMARFVHSSSYVREGEPTYRGAVRLSGDSMIPAAWTGRLHIHAYRTMIIGQPTLNSMQSRLVTWRNTVTEDKGICRHDWVGLDRADTCLSLLPIGARTPLN